MKIDKSEFIISAVSKKQYPTDDKPQVVLVGRSNVGKSSLINTLANRKSLARTSVQPGKTRLLNFYQIFSSTDIRENLEWYLVDLPGYGYAKVSQDERLKWGTMITEYLADSPGLKYCFQLLDIRHAPSVQDKEMNKMLTGAGYHLFYIITKADKISRGVRDRNLAVICKDLKITRGELIVFSAVTKEGREAILEQIAGFIGSY